MAKTLTKDMTVGSMVAEDFKRAEVFEHLGIDYCCHGSDTLEAACAKQNLKPEDVLDAGSQYGDHDRLARFLCMAIGLAS